MSNNDKVEKIKYDKSFTLFGLDTRTNSRRWTM